VAALGLHVQDNFVVVVPIPLLHGQLPHLEMVRLFLCGTDTRERERERESKEALSDGRSMIS
jgi:hypothetical protein